MNPVVCCVYLVILMNMHLILGCVFSADSNQHLCTQLCIQSQGSWQDGFYCLGSREGYTIIEEEANNGC